MTVDGPMATRGANRAVGRPRRRRVGPDNHGWSDGHSRSQPSRRTPTTATSISVVAMLSPRRRHSRSCTPAPPPRRVRTYNVTTSLRLHDRDAGRQSWRRTKIRYRVHSFRGTPLHTAVYAVALPPRAARGRQSSSVILHLQDFSELF